MDALRQKVRIARRRLTVQRFVEILPWCLFATLSAALVLVAVGRFVPLPFGPEVWLGGGAAIGVLAAIVWTFATRRDELAAAIELDRRFGLKERVSSALVLDAAALETPVAQALQADAQRRVERIDVGAQFRPQFGRRAWLPLVPAVLAFAFVLFIEPPTDNPWSAEAKQDAEAQAARIENSTHTLRQNLAQQRKEAKERGLKDAGELFDKLEKETQQLSDKKVDQKQALLKLNNLASELENRRKELTGSESVREQMKELGKSLSKGPADKMAEALEKGNLQQAMNELEKMKDRLKKKQMGEEERQELAKQMDEIADKLKKAAEAREKQLQKLQKQIAEKRANGDAQAANELEKQLAKLAQNSKQSGAMKKLSDQAQQLSKALQKNNAQDLSKAMDDLSRSMESMAASDAEQEMIDAAMDQITTAKNTMAGKGEAENGQQGDLDGGQGPGQGQGQGQVAGQQGGGVGGSKPGTGFGDRTLRPGKVDETTGVDSRVRQQVGKGSGVVTDLVDGPSTKGDVRQQIREQFEAAQAEATDPLTGQQLSRGQRDHAKEYFDKLREGSN